MQACFGISKKEDEPAAAYPQPRGCGWRRSGWKFDAVRGGRWNLAYPVGINHISYRVANYAKTRDFYSGLLGMKVSNDDGTKCRLGVGGISIVAQLGEDERTRRTPLIDHIDYNMDNSQQEIFAALKNHGVVLEHGINHPPSNKAKAGSTSIQVKDPDGFHVTLSPKK